MKETVKIDENIIQDTKSKTSYINKHRLAIMGTMTIWIWFLHCWMILFYGWKLVDYEWAFKWTGILGVDVFLFLSGMGLTYAIKKYSLKEFYKRRYRRIAFPYFFRGIVQAIKERWTIGKFFWMVSGAAMFFEYVISYLWFGTAIAIFYLFFPLYYHLFEKSKNKIRFTLAAILIWFIIAYILKFFIRVDLYDFINRIPIFLIGILFGYLVQNGLDLNKPIALVISIPIFIVGYYIEYIATFDHVTFILPGTRFFLPSILCGPTLTIILSFVFELFSKCKLTMIINKILSCYGIVSFEFFCVSQGFLDTLVYLWVGEKVSGIEYNIISFIICTLSAVLVYYLGKYFWKFVDWISSKIHNHRMMVSKTR